MKIFITHTEVRQLLISRYGFPDNTEVKVGPAPKPQTTADRIVALLRQKGFLDQSGNVLPNHKIDSIGLLREEIPGLGLAEAKTAVENWKIFLNNIDTNTIIGISNGSIVWGA